MKDERSPPSTLKGRLADVYVPALVDGTLDALSRRLGNRATLDDPTFGRATSLVSIDPFLAETAAALTQVKASYEPVGSTTGIDRDVAEGRLLVTVDGEQHTVPVAVLAERRRLREIELRIYYRPFTSRTPGRPPRASMVTGQAPPLAHAIENLIAELCAGEVEATLSGFEANGRAVDSHGRIHAKHDEGALGRYLGDLRGLQLRLGGTADDGRTACVEATILRPRESRLPSESPVLFAFQRGPNGLIEELRVYSDE
jgi:hypothetical protein